MSSGLSAVARAALKGCSVKEAKRDPEAAQRRCEAFEALVSKTVIERSRLQAKIHQLNKKEIDYLAKLRAACDLRDSHWLLDASADDKTKRGPEEG